MFDENEKKAGENPGGAEDNCISRIRSNYHALTKSQRRIADYIHAHRHELAGCSITSLSRKIGTNPPGLTRFCQALHYKGFGEFKFFLEKAMVSPPGAAKTISDGDDLGTIRAKLLELGRDALSDTLLLLDERMVMRAAKAICSANMLHIYADGGPGASSNFAYQLFLQIGIPCNFFIDYNLSLMAAGQLRKGDVAMGITYSGSSIATISALEIAAQRGATIVGITARANSRVAKMADIPLCYSPKIEDDLRYLHLARICEVAIIGFLQSAVLSYIPERVSEHLQFSKKAINRARKERR